jgi:hypothetical protein
MWDEIVQTLMFSVTHSIAQFIRQIRWQSPENCPTKVLPGFAATCFERQKNPIHSSVPADKNKEVNPPCRTLAAVQNGVLD